MYPVDFAARGSCSIGGNIATNAGGIRVIRYGNTREWVAGLKVVTGSGELLELNNALVKNSSGYDFRHLMIGSEGTLGIVVEATLRLTDPPPPSNVMLLALPSFDVLMQVFAAFRAQLRLEAFEFLPIARWSMCLRMARRRRSPRFTRITWSPNSRQATRRRKPPRWRPSRPAWSRAGSAMA